ncbi:MAG: hypothetical protein QGH94_01295 [Phycisphaerae bacterium]|jgi:hypothetical protein|nr:hypothetical protein [Phycisphaerae bacterium]MDP7286605.1 hypothetical protein [Phycisphaerae bacterium]
MITTGSVTREEAVTDFAFLSANFRGRRKAIKEFTHAAPDYVFWIHPDGRLFDAKNSHKKNCPKGFEHILDDEPDYCGFLRGRVASNFGPQLIVVYCRPEALARAGAKLTQFLNGVSQIPAPVSPDALVVSDNADIYGSLDDLLERRDAN